MEKKIPQLRFLNYHAYVKCIYVSSSSSRLLPKEAKANGGESNADTTAATTAQENNDDDEAVSSHNLSNVEITELSGAVGSDNLIDESQQQHENAAIPPEYSTKFDQYLLDSLTAAVTSASSTSINSGFQNCGSAGNLQNSTNDTHEMPQLLNILNELLDGQDITSLANSGGNGDIVDQEENYEDDLPRKDDPDEIAKQIATERLEVISQEEQQLQRRMDFLVRRLYKLVARSTGLHVSEEIAGFLEHVARFTKRKDKEKEKQNSVSSKFPYLTANLQGTSTSSTCTELLKSPPVSQEPPVNLLSTPSTQEKNEIQEPTVTEQSTAVQEMKEEETNTVPIKDVIEPTVTDSLKPVPIHEMKSFLKRIENISRMQSIALNRRGLAFKYFTKSSSNNLNQAASKSHIHSHHHESSSSSNNNFKVSAIPKFEDADVEQVEQTSGLLMTEMRLIENQIDSDATASSTGGESADEMTAYTNNYQQPLSM